MKRLIEAKVVQTLAALLALMLCTVTASAQPVTSPLTTRAEACGQWAEPLTIEIPPDRRVAMGRLVELVAEDVSNAQFRAALPLPAGEFPYTRLATRPPRAMHATSLAALVGSIYTGGTIEVRQAIVRRLRDVIRRAGMTYTSIEEKRFCCLTRTSTGERLCEMPVNMTCTNGLPPSLVSRNRYLRSGFQDNFYAESFVAGDSFDRSDWRSAPGYGFRVFLKPGRRPFIMNIARVHSAEQHPRPAAALCRELPLLAAAPPPTDAVAKECIFSRMADLAAKTIAEGDLTAAIWATHVVREVSIRVADLEALGHAQAETRGRDQRLQTRWEELKRVRADRDSANITKTRWRTLAVAALLISLIAIAVAIALGFHARRKGIERELSRFLASLEDELFAWTQLVHSQTEEANLVLGLKPDNIAAQLFEKGEFLNFLRLVREKTQTALETARGEARAYSRVVLDIVGKDDIAAILKIPTARSESSGSIVLEGTPLTAPRARDFLDRLVSHFQVLEGRCGALQRAAEVRDGRLKKLADSVHSALGAKTLEAAKQLLTDALIAALQDDEAPTLKRDPTPTG